MIEFDNVSFGYEKDRLLFENLSFKIYSKERVYIVGESGVGKTTFLRLVMGVEKPLSGAIKSDVKRTAPVFQEDRLVMGWSGYENIAFCNDRIDPEIAEMMEINELLDKHVSELSGGERRRIALCRALNHKGDLLVLDEPFNGIDNVNINLCINAINYSMKDATIILVTHQSYQAEMLGCKAVNLFNK